MPDVGVIQSVLGTKYLAEKYGGEKGEKAGSWFDKEIMGKKDKIPKPEMETRQPTAEVGYGQRELYGAKGDHLAGKTAFEADKTDVDTGKADVSRGEQSDFQRMMLDRAEGRSTGAAEQQFREGSEANIRSLLAARASQRGGNPAAMNRQLQQQLATSGQQAAAQAAVIRGKEQQAAEQAYGEMATTMREQGFTEDEIQAKMDQEINIVNLESQIENRQLTEDLRLKWAELGLVGDELEATVAMERDRIIAEQNIAKYGGEADVYATEVSQPQERSNFRKLLDPMDIL